MRDLQNNLDMTHLNLAITKAILRKDIRAERVLSQVRDEELRIQSLVVGCESEMEFEVRTRNGKRQYDLTPAQETERWRAMFSASVNR